ncbi:MAG: hypothetical protein ACE5FH_00745 [Candidatus Zixiibacteriota bacterium]
MSICPKCHFEYESDVEVCPDCSEMLVDMLPPASPVAQTPDDSWVAVGKVASEWQSEIARGALDSGNIPSVILSSSFNAFGLVAQEAFISSQGAGSNLIMVPREFYDEAEVLLEAVLGEDFSSNDPETTSDRT